MDKIYDTAFAIKNRIYGNRIVLFAPLYIANYCVNSCTYCAFRTGNKSLKVVPWSFACLGVGVGCVEQGSLGMCKVLRHRFLHFNAAAHHTDMCYKHTPHCPQRMALTDDELRGEVEALEKQGHRRLLVLTGEHPKYTFDQFLKVGVGVVAQAVWGSVPEREAGGTWLAGRRAGGAAHGPSLFSTSAHVCTLLHRRRLT